MIQQKSPWEQQLTTGAEAVGTGTESTWYGSLLRLLWWHFKHVMVSLKDPSQQPVTSSSIVEGHGFSVLLGAVLTEGCA